MKPSHFSWILATVYSDKGRAARTAETMMQLKGIRDDLRHYLHLDRQNRRMRYADLGRLIDALEKKAADLQRQLDLEEDRLKRRHLKIEIQVARMQHAKAIRRRCELQEDSTSSYAPRHGSAVADATD